MIVTVQCTNVYHVLPFLAALAKRHALGASAVWVIVRVVVEFDP